MQLTRFTDYSLRTLIFVGMHENQLVTIHEIAEHYDISQAHLVKVVHKLGKHGYVETVRGRDGGMRLARRPELISVGEVIRDTEENMDIAECFSDNKSCRLLPSCVLKSAFAEARKNFLATLDAYHLSDLLVGKVTATEAVIVHMPKQVKKKLARGRLQKI